MNDLLASYYKKMKRIEYLKRRYERLSTSVNEIFKCISNESHTLEVLLPSQGYDREQENCLLERYELEAEYEDLHTLIEALDDENK